MPLVSENPPRWRAAGSGNLSCLENIDGTDTAPISAPNQAEILRNPLAVAAMRRELNLEFLHECAGGISVHSALAQTFCEIGDVAGTCYSLTRLFAHAKAMHPIFLELRDGAASSDGVPS